MRGPQRTCIGCRKVAAPDELIRVVRRPDGSFEVGRSAPGRGAWLCRGSPACLEQALRRRAFERALKGAVSEQAIHRLRAAVAERARMDDRHTGAH